MGRIRQKTVEPSPPAQSCPMCKALDVEEMVQCDECDRFFHFTCVRVDATVANRPWSCATCKRKAQSKQKGDGSGSSLTPKQPVVHSPAKKGAATDPPRSISLESSSSTPTTSSASGGSLNVKVSLPESLDHAKALKQLKTTGDLLAKSTETINELKKSHAAEMQALKAQVADQMKVAEAACEAASEARRIAEERATEVRRNAEEATKRAESETNELRKQLAELRNSNVAQLSRNSPEETSQNSNQSNEDLLTQQERIVAEAEVALRDAQASSQARVSSFTSDPLFSKVQDMVNHLLRSNSTQGPQSAPTLGRTSANVFDEAFDSHDTTGTQGGSMDRLATTMGRQYLQKLPTFSGNIKEWAAFEHIYNQTTVEGKFTPSDNVARLREALKPPASQLVLSLILYSSDADRIMEELRDAYGKPDDLIAVALEEMFALPVLRSEVDPGLRTLMIHMRNYVATLDSLGATSELTGIFTLRRVVPKLHHHHQTEWHELKLRNPRFDLRDFADFLVRKVKQMPTSLSESQSKIIRNQMQTQSNDNRGKRVLSHQQTVKPRTEGCFKCNGPHLLYNCQEFLQLTLKARYDLINQKRICSACLKSTSHGWRECTTKRACGIDNCQKFHNRCLHSPKSRVETRSGNGEVQQPGNSNSNPPSGAPNANANSFVPRNASTSGNLSLHFSATCLDGRQPLQPAMNHMDSEPVLFKIVPINISGRFGSIDTYAFLDDGSSLTLLEQDIFDKLHLEGKKKDLYLKWSNGIVRKEESFVTELSVASTKSRRHHTLTEVHTVKNLDLPAQTVDIEMLRSQHAHLRGLPIPSMNHARPQILIGLLHASFLNGSKYHSAKGGAEAPIACKTRLGWTVYGPTAPLPRPFVAQGEFKSGVQLTIHQATANDSELSTMVKEFFSTDNFGVMPPQRDLISEAEQRAKEIMTNTLKRVGDRYEIGLLWKKDDICLPDSWPMAFSRLKLLEKSLKKKPELLAWKNNHVQQLIAKGYARKATAEDLNTKWPRIWYCPTFVTINNNKIPPKPRDVADVAATVNGMSLNSNLLKGPDNMAPLLQALFKFRENFIAVNSDVQEMFHQISIKPEDQQCQRFLWRDGDESKPPTVYIMQRMMFGPTCSPTCAQFVKNTHAEKYSKSHPEASKAIRMTTYVDDYFNSHATLSDARRVIRDSIDICKSMGFNLVGFQSNAREALEELPPELCKSTTVSIDSRESQIETSKLLGVVWQPKQDYITYKVNHCEVVEKIINSDYGPTKREMLRTIMRIFDPLGLIAHYLIRGKIILQEVWREGVGWDEPVGDSLRIVWKEFITQIPNISLIRIPRHYAPVNPIEQHVQLLVFVDASEKAFGGIAYFRFSRDGDVHVAQVMGKAKVAPIKKLTIPQLELQAAVLGVRMSETIKKMHDFPIHEVTFLSDSRVVLAWINSKKFNFKVFVAARIGEILSSSTPNQWFHVGTKENVADDATKFTDPSMGDNDTRWFQGPAFLIQDQKSWPIKPADSFQEEVESSPTYLSMVHLNYARCAATLESIDCIKARFRARWTSLTRVTAFMLRLSTRRRRLGDFPGSFITPAEFLDAEDVIFRKIQHDSFKQELSELDEVGSVSRRSKIYQLSPFLEDGVIRLRSRAQRANISYASRNPPILPNKHELIDIFIQHHHEKNFHMGDELIIADLRERSWIVNIRSAVQRVKRNCQHCKIKRARPQMPQMGELPLARVDFGVKPFTHTGLDAFGPYLLKRGRSNVKRYGLIFTCLTYRAVHLEMLDDMSTDSCVLAIRRFLTRRGWCSRFYSDNGSNFKGSKNLLLKEFSELKATLEPAASKVFGIQWQFIPAYSPWFGGAWERLIQSIKKCIDFVMRGEEPNEKIFQNALVEAEFWMNRRPLTHAPIDHEDAKPLTPNSVLYGDDQTELALLLGGYTIADKFSTKAHRRAQHLVDKFRHRWIKEYLPQINRRSKWYETKNPIKVGDVVIVTEPNLGQDAWKRGRVAAVYAGKDGVVRTVDVILPDKTVVKNRSTGRLAVLDVINRQQINETNEPGGAMPRDEPTDELVAQCSVLVDNTN